MITMTTIKTTDIEVAIAALQTKTLIHFDGGDAGWGDQELYRIIQCLNEGCGIKLKTINLSSNNFSQGAMKLLLRIIGPTAIPAMRRVTEQHVKKVNPQ